jgi:hypothetical protein
MWIDEEYRVFFKDMAVGIYYVMEDGSSSYSFSDWALEDYEGDDVPEEIKHHTESKKGILFLEDIIDESNRVLGTRKAIYRKGNLAIERIPDNVDRFMVYRVGAEKGDPEYSEKKHSARHYEGPKTPEDMTEWTTWYAFNKKDDGMYEAELDESWWWGGGHNDGGTMHAEIPEEWLDLPYEEFLDRVLDLVSARHYGFTVEELLARKGLREFFGFGDDA